MTDTERTVLASLRCCGAIPAVEIGHRCGMAHETLYGALVGLEAKGLARVVVNHVRGLAHERLWRAA